MPDPDALEAMAVRCEALSHMSRPLNDEINKATSEEFSRNHTGYFDDAFRALPAGWIWTAGIAERDEEPCVYGWANVRHERHGEIIVHAATPVLAMCAASLRALASQQRNDGGKG